MLCLEGKKYIYKMSKFSLGTFWGYRLPGIDLTFCVEAFLSVIEFKAVLHQGCSSPCFL